MHHVYVIHEIYRSENQKIKLFLQNNGKLNNTSNNDKNPVRTFNSSDSEYQISAIYSA